MKRPFEDFIVDLKLSPEAGAYGTAFALTRWTASNYTWQFVFIMVLAFVTSIFENVGLLLILPIFEITTSQQAGLATSEASNFVSRYIRAAFDALHIEFNLVNVLAVFIGMILLKAVTNTFATWIRNRFTLWVGMAIRFRLASSIMMASWEHIGKSSAGRMANMLSVESARFVSAVNGSIQFCTAVITALAYAAFAMALDWVFVVGISLIGILSLVVARPLLAVSLKQGYRQTGEMNDMIALFVQAIRGLKVLKATDNYRQTLSLLHARNRALLTSQLKGMISAALLKQAQEPIGAVVLAGMLYVGVAVMGQNIAVLGVMVLLLIRLVTRLWEVQQVAQAVGGFAGSVSTLFKTIGDAVGARETLDEGGKQVDLSETISLDNVSLSYDDAKVVDAVKITIPFPGLTVLTGPSGGGKTTIVDSVLGFKTPRSGRIKIDGNDLHEIDIRHWRRQIGYLPQEVFLFDDSVRNNVSMGDKSMSDESIIDALKKAEIWEFVNGAGSGLDFRVAEGGGNLSGGQRQRIALARALVRSPSLLVLDEATSALDRENRELIVETLRQQAQSMAILAITHDEVLLGAAERVYLVKDGKVKKVSGRQAAEIV